MNVPPNLVIPLTLSVGIEISSTLHGQLAVLIPRFHSERFLFDYLDSEKLLYRLNQVMRRVKLHALPPRTVDVLESARPVVRENADALLAPYHSFPVNTP